MAELKRYGAVLLAAGFSRRLPGENKLLRAYRGEPLLGHALRGLASLGLGDIAVVTGDDERLVALAGQAGLRSYRNPRAAEGMGASISAGIAALRPELAGVFIVLGDMPKVTAEDFACLALAHGSLPERICVPVWQGRRGHPVLFGGDYRSELAALTGDTGAREILERHTKDVVEVPAVSQGVLLDLDTAADFAAPWTETPPQL